MSGGFYPSSPPGRMSDEEKVDLLLNQMIRMQKEIFDLQINLEQSRDNVQFWYKAALAAQKKLAGVLFPNAKN